MNRATLRLRAFNIGLLAATALAALFGGTAAESGLPQVYVATGIGLGALYGAALGWAYYVHKTSPAEGRAD